MAKVKKTIAAQIKGENLETVQEMTTKEEKEKIPAIYGKSARLIEKTNAAELSEDGFLLSIDDPFAEGALRIFKALKNEDNLCLPVLLPFKDGNSKATLENYILRARGGGDIERVDVAGEAMKKMM